MDDYQLGELVAHTYSAYQIALDLQLRHEQREYERLRKARQRANAATQTDSAAKRELRSA